jgi:hypothetical protein
VKKEFDGIGLHATTIWKYVNANIAGMSPLKPGVKGEVPAWAFQTLCIAFVSYVRIQQINSREGEISYKKACTKNQSSADAQLQTEDATTRSLGDGKRP